MSRLAKHQNLQQVIDPWNKPQRPNEESFPADCRAQKPFPVGHKNYLTTLNLQVVRSRHLHEKFWAEAKKHYKLSYSP